MKKFKFLFIALAFGIIIFSVMYFLSNRIVSVNVETNNENLRKKISFILENNNVKTGTYIPSLNFDKIENRLKISLNEISDAIINRNGSEITVKIIEAEKKPNIANTENPCNIIAECDMKICDAKVYKGKLFAPAGSEIRQGDIIISGKYKSEKSEVSLLRHADGIIKAELKKEVVFTQKKADIKLSESGKSYSIKKLKFFSLNLNLGNRKKNIYSNFIVKQNTKTLSLFGKKMPVSLITSTYKEKTPCLSICSDEYASELITKQKEVFEKNVLSDYKIVNSESKTEISDYSVTQTVTYTLYGSVGTRQDILVCPFAN